MGNPAPTSPPPPRPPGPPYRLLLLGTTVLGLITSAQHFAVMQVSDVRPAFRTVPHALIREMPWWYLWVLAAPIALFAIRRLPFARRPAGAVAGHLAVGIAVVMVHGVLLLAIHRLGGYQPAVRPFWTTYLSNIGFRLPTGLLGYGVLFGAMLAWDFYSRFRERELAAAALGAQLAEARLQALRMQLNPHFLFNAMNTIAMQVRRQENGAAVRMIAGLSELLRYVLAEARDQEAPLRGELGFVDRFLELERTRLPDRLSYKVTAAPDTLDALVPNLILQPLVENAVKHGVARHPRGGAIAVRADRRGGLLVLEVEDDGPGLRDLVDGAVTPATGIPVSAGGIGLRNTAARLAQLHGAAGRLELEATPKGGFLARVTLPFRRAASAGAEAA